MDNKKLAKLIDGIVKLRLEKILKSNEFKSVIKEAAQKEVIKILLEAKGTSTVQKSKKTMNNVLGEGKKKTYPKLPNKTYSKNPILNNLLQQTVRDAVYSNESDTLGHVDGGPSIKVGNVNVPINMTPIDTNTLANESMLLAQSELGKYGMHGNVIKEDVDLESTPRNVNFRDSFAEEYVNDNSVDDISDVDFDQIQNKISNVLNKDYTKLLEKADEKAKQKRALV